jgi:hypothetical protein
MNYRFFAHTQYIVAVFLNNGKGKFAQRSPQSVSNSAGVGLRNKLSRFKRLPCIICSERFGCVEF